MELPPDFCEPSPAPWHYAEHIYGLPHCLLDRDGRVIGSHFPIGNGATMAAAPAMVSLLRELIAGVPPDGLRQRAAAILRQIECQRPREPGEDDE
jgi:hypothetical protein